MTEDEKWTEKYWWMNPEELEKLAKWGVDHPPSEDEELKQALLEQHHREHFEAPDPSDDLTDDEIMAMLPKHYREDK